MVNRLFPESIIVQVMRDPRANVSSQRSRWPQFSVWTCAMWWREAAIAGQKWGRENPSRYVAVQYEDLVLAPEETMRTLCRQLDIPFSPQLITFDQQETMWEPGSGPQQKRFSRPDPSRINLWQQYLSAQDVRLIEYGCRAQMALGHYQPLYDSPLTTQLRLRQLKEASQHRLLFLGKGVKSYWRRLKARRALW